VGEQPTLVRPYSGTLRSDGVRAAFGGGSRGPSLGARHPQAAPPRVLPDEDFWTAWREQALRQSPMHRGRPRPGEVIVA
jgi:hypothetical protein